MKRKKTKRAVTVYEDASAGRTGASVRKLRKEQTAAESLGALARARSVYAEGGDVNSCGDWLALALKEHCHSEDGFAIGKFERVLKENDIEWDINRKTHGWIGRFRMNGRQKLAAVARKSDTFLSVVKRSERPERRSAVESQKRL
jgi:hypothetical protein